MYRWWIAYKYICSRFITVAALLAVTLSVTVLIIVVAVMEGFRSEMQDRIRGTTSDIIIESEIFLGLEKPGELQKLVEEIEGVESAAPFVQTFALYTPPSGRESKEAVELRLSAMDLANKTSRAELNKILRALPSEPDFSHLDYRFDGQRSRRENNDLVWPYRGPVKKLFKNQPRKATDLFSKEWIEKGLWDALEVDPGKIPSPNPRALLPPIVLGVECFRYVEPLLFIPGEFPRLQSLLPGSTIKLTSFTADGARPAEQDFLIVGYFKTGLYELDSRGVILPLKAADHFLSLTDATAGTRVSGIRVSAEPGHSTPQKLQALKQKIEHKLYEAETLFVKTQTWTEAKATLLNAVRAEKVIVSIILGVVILFAGFMIFIILTVQVVEKSRDIGILQSIGATSRGVSNLFFFAGTSICLTGLSLGTLYGVSFGLGINTIQRWIHLLTGQEIFPQDIYYLDHIPVKFLPEDLAFIILTTVAVSLLASIIPARRAAKKLSTEGLRYS